MNLSVSKRLALGFGIVVGIGMGIAVYGAIQMRQLNHGIAELAHNRMLKMEQLRGLKDNLQTIGRLARNIVIHNEPAFVRGEKQKIEDLRSSNSAILAALDKSLTLPQARTLYQVIIDNRQPYNAAMDQAIALAEKGDQAAAADQLIGNVRRLQNILFKATDDSIDMQQQLAQQLAASSEQASSSGVIWLSGLAVLMAGIGAAAALLVSRSVTRPLNQAVQVANAIEQGDLTQRIAEGRQDELGVLLRSLSRMQSSLIQVVSRVRSNSQCVATASAEIAHGNADLSQRTEEQASALEETAATMEELGSTVRHNSDNAQQANQLAQDATAIAARGGEMVGQVVSTMQGISDSSRRIGDIIGVIDGIAFQTNILALNAAVEAARAGEQGRGFAVVASEVRSLAQRSAAAAKEIKALIVRSAEQVEHGSSMVDRTGQTMDEIVHSIRRVSAIVAEITAASVEQSSGISQVGDAVGQMDQVTQQNAALVEQSAAAAESLKGQAEQLVKAVAVFKLSAEALDPTSTVAAAPRIADLHA